MSERYSNPYGTADGAGVFIDTRTGAQLTNDQVLDLLNSTVWTGVNDGLPEHRTRVRVTFEFANGVKGEDYGRHLGRQGWQFQDGRTPEDLHAKVTHWQPIRGPK